jgi:glycosyltransferase involved in cell wall biosynthesis
MDCWTIKSDAPNWRIRRSAAMLVTKPPPAGAGRPRCGATAPGALAQALDELLSDPERRRIMGAAGRRAVLARHSTEVQMKRFLALVGEVMESAS